MYKTSLKWQIYRNREQISGCQEVTNEKELRQYFEWMYSNAFQKQNKVKNNTGQDAGVHNHLIQGEKWV